jgi:hypothetical protein
MLVSTQSRTFCLLSKNVKIRIYKTIILSVVLYGFETWSLTLSHIDCENRVLRRIFGPKRDEVTGDWRKLNNEELHKLYSSPKIIRTIKSRRMKWAGNIARTGEKRNAYRILVGKTLGKRPLGRQRRRWVDNIRLDLRDIRWDGFATIGLSVGTPHPCLGNVRL